MQEQYLAAPRLNRRVQLIIVMAMIIVFLAGTYTWGRAMGSELIAADFSQKGLAPSWEHPFGTDMLGRDMLARTMKGISLSMTVGAVASGVSALIALLVGIAAATGSAWLDHCINWLIDLVMSMPHMVLLILISFACGRGLQGVLIGIAVTHWTALARIIRGEVLQVRHQPYVVASRKMGRSTAWITMNHLLPHLLPQFFIGLILMFPHAIMHESGLTFLGFGLHPEQPAIGIILAESMRYLSAGMWWHAFFPGLMLVLVVLMFSQLGDCIRKLVDPNSAQE